MDIWFARSMEKRVTTGPGPLCTSPASRPHGPRGNSTTSTGDWYENAHRVSVRWCGQFATLSCLGRVWLKAFGQVVKGAEEVLQAAAKRDLPALR
jgi:hypothetical protein